MIQTAKHGMVKYNSRRQALVLCGFGKWFALLALILFSVTSAFPQKAYRAADVDTLNRKAYQYLNTKPDTSLKLGFRAVRMALQVDYLSGHTDALQIVGWSYFYLSKYKKALQYFIAANTKATERKQDPQQGEALFGIGQVYYDWGEYRKALDYFLQSLAVREKTRDTVNIARCLSRIGKVHESLGNLPKALTNYQRALKLYGKMNDQAGIAGAYADIGVVYDQQRKYEEALNFHQQALAIYRQLNAPQGISLSFHNMGDVFFHREDYQKALNYYFRSLSRDLQQRPRVSVRVAAHYNRIGQCYYSIRKYQQAIYYFEKAVVEARIVGAKETILRSFAGMAESYARMGEYQQAYESQKLYTAVKDSIFTEQTASEITETEAKYELQNQQREVELLRKEKKIQSITLERNRQLNYLMGVLLVLVLVLGIVYINRYLIKQRANSLLSARTQIIQAQNRDLQAVNEKLKASELHLKSLVATKDKFFTIISHDLRVPLNALTQLLQILMGHMDNFSREELKTFASHMDHTVKNLMNLLENLLHWSQSQRGNIAFNPQPLPLPQLIEEVYDLLEPMATQKGIALLMKIPPEVSVVADRNMLDFVLRNMVVNAIKFTNSGGKVETAAIGQGDRVEIRVMDTGIGIPEDKLANLFQLDMYHKTSGTANEAGTGLGLLLCQEFVSRHGGMIRVQSTVNEGTTFCFSLPAHVLAVARH